MAAKIRTARSARTTTPVDKADSADSADQAETDSAPSPDATTAPDTTQATTPDTITTTQAPGDVSTPVPATTPAVATLSPEAIQDAMRIMAEEAERRAASEAELARAQAEEEARRQRALAELAKARMAEDTRHALASLLTAVTATYAALATDDQAAIANGLEAIYAATNDVRRASRTTTTPTTSTSRGRTGGATVRITRSAPRPLRPEVLAHLHTHPGIDFTPGEIAKVLDRSSGAVANALDALVKQGRAVLTSEHPHRYRATNPDTPPAPGATVTATARPHGADSA